MPILPLLPCLFFGGWLFFLPASRSHPPDRTPPIALLCDLFHLSSADVQVVRMLNLAALSSNYGRRQNSSDQGALFLLHNLFTTICLHCLNDKLKKRFQLCPWRSCLSLPPFMLLVKNYENLGFVPYPNSF